jgi:Glycine rich protein
VIEQESPQTNSLRRARLLRFAFGCLLAIGLLIPAAASANTFSSTGAEQTYTVPAGATEIHVVAVGGSGGGHTSTGGRGGVVTANIPVTPGLQLFVEVGGNGEGCFLLCPGGFNGGGQADGGGASDVRTASCGSSCPGSDASLASRLLVAGGGGGGGTFAGGDAGADGSGGDLSGEGGSQTRGGRGGTFTGTGLCSSGSGGNGAAGQGGGSYTGGGGGGYFGGGGGAVDFTSALDNNCLFATGVSGAGGGGSDYVEPGAHDVAYGLDSTATPQVTITVEPVLAAAPSISGGAVQRQPLTVVHGTWSGGVSAFAYQWERCDAGGANCVAIPGATNQTYVLANADVGSTLRVQETAKTPDGGSATATTAPTAVVQPLAASPTPGIAGAAVQGQVLSEIHGGWPGGATSVAYQWQRCNPAGAGCVPIGGAINQTYALTAADVGSTIRVLESVAYADGNTAAATTAQTSVIQPIAPARVTIVGPAHALVGARQTYRASVTDSQGVPSTFRWTVGGHVVGLQPTLSYSFTHPGHQLILLQVADTSGNSFAATQSVGVTYPRLQIHLSWNASNSPRSSTFTSLIAHGVPAGVQIELTCAGSCPFAHRSLTVAAAAHCHGKECKSVKRHAPPGSRDVDLTSLVAGERLSVGTTLTIRFTKKAYVGEVEVFTIATGGPTRRADCLSPGSPKPGKGC